MSILLFVVLSIGSVEFGAAHLRYESKMRTVTLAGSAWVRTGDIQLFADSITYLSNYQIIYAHGNCTLIVRADTMTGDSLGYNLKTDDGVMWHGRAHVEKGWITGDALVKIGKDTILIKHGSFTTCDLVPPHYEFVADRMKLEGKELGIVQPLILKVHELPVFYAPFWFFPLRRDRHSGFLMPSIGYNSIDGKYIRRLRYYLVLNNYSDITFGMDIIEKRGPKFDVQAVYKLYKRFNGELNFSWADDYSVKRVRWSASGRHFQDFGHGWTLRANGNFASDRNFSQDYFEQHDQWLKQDMRSFVSLSKRFKFASMNVSFNRLEDMTNGSGNFQAPSVSFNLFNKTIWKFNISANSVFQRAGQFDTLSSSVRWAWRNRASVSSSIKLLRYFNFMPSVSFTSTVYDTNILGHGPFEVHGFTGSASISTVLYGISVFGIGPIKRFRHTLRPSIGFNYSEKEDKDSLTAPFGQFGRLPLPSKRGSYRISNDFDARLENGTVISLLSLDISGAYDLDKSEKPLTPISISLNSSPYRKLSIRGNVYVDPYSLDWSNASLSTGLSFSLNDPRIAEWDTTKRTWSVSMYHTLSKSSPERKAVQRVSVSISGKPTPNWSVKYSFNYNPETGKIVDQYLSLNRDLHCWAFSLRWSKLGERTNYDFRVWIKALPDVSIRKNLLQLFLP